METQVLALIVILLGLWVGWVVATPIAAKL